MVGFNSFMINKNNYVILKGSKIGGGGFSFYLYCVEINNDEVQFGWLEFFRWVKDQSVICCYLNFQVKKIGLIEIIYWNYQ